GGDTAEDDDVPAARLQAREDVVAEAGLADRGRQGRDADDPHRGGADAGDDHGGGEGQLDAPKQLGLGHAHAARGLDDTGIDAGDTGDGVAEHGEHAVEAQGGDG